MSISAGQFEMLEMKAWLETRWPLLFAFVMALAVVLVGKSGGGLHSTLNAHNMIAALSFIFIVCAINFGR